MAFAREHRKSETVMADDPSGGWLEFVKGFREVIGAGRDLGNLWEWIQKYREGNLSKVLARTKEILRPRGISEHPDTPPPRFVVPLLEQASYEDDEGLQELWSGLLANAMDPARRQRPKRVFGNLLSSLEPTDAAILNYTIKRVHPGEEITVEQLAGGTGFSEEELHLSLQNLTRLGCLDDRSGAYWTQPHMGPPGPRIVCAGQMFEIRPLAYELLKACEH